MQKAVETKSNKTDVYLKRSYMEALEDPNFKKLVKRIGVDSKVAMKYTSQLEDSVHELANCSECEGIICCRNKIEGYVYYPVNKKERLDFTYAPCKYKKAYDEALEIQNKSSNIYAKMADIDINDKKRVKVIKWLKKFYDDFDLNKKCKGLYLHGNFGCGKTYLISALFNELAKKRLSIEIIYFPELLRELKGNFELIDDRITYLQTVDLLLIDDIGAEKVSEWGRDEILGTILQYRMNNAKATFFTSNLTIDELEIHLSISGGNEDKVKARRIVERIKQLAEDMEMISENRRK